MIKHVEPLFPTSFESRPIWRSGICWRCGIGYGKLALKVLKPEIKDVLGLFQRNLVESGVQAAQTLGHIGFHRATDKLCDGLERAEDFEAAASFQENFLKVLKTRMVKLPTNVEDEIKQRISQCRSKR